ncbi:MAG: ABC transporter substrate-binding protein [Candidatus Rokubacteria bacterium]|nr:ABC transporter substrate-binding protein [Candidatus Rokubacteria bacterium]
MVPGAGWQAGVNRITSRSRESDSRFSMTVRSVRSLVERRRRSSSTSPARRSHGESVRAIGPLVKSGHSSRPSSSKADEERRSRLAPALLMCVVVLLLGCPDPLHSAESYEHVLGTWRTAEDINACNTVRLRYRDRRIVTFREVESYQKQRGVRAVKLAAAKVYRIGVLEAVDAESNVANLSAFRQGLAELGYVEGQNVVIEYRSADGRPERFRDLARELVRLEVDVIVTRGSPAALSAKHVTRTIPIVMASSGDPAAEGIVRRLSRPEANVTGFHTLAPPRLGAERLRLLKEVVPRASRVGILWNVADIQPPLIVRETERIAGSVGVQLKSVELQSRRAFDEAFEAALTAQVDAIIAVEDHLTFTGRARIVEFAAMSRMPAIYGLREFVEAGGLMSYGTDRRDLFRRSAAYVHRILTGSKPADLPVEPPTRFELAINLKTAKTLGLTIPPSLLQRADYVVE